jgi:hypothetical protein
LKLVKCTKCSSKELIEQDGYVLCLFCRSRFVPQPEDIPEKDTVVGLDSDIEMLLRKCEEDPANRQRYAGLVLDLDPTNSVARGYLS